MKMKTDNKKSEAAALAEAAFIAAQLVWLIGAGGFVWVLRDGLGPDATRTTGVEALERMFGTFYWGPVCLAFLIVDAIWLCRRLRGDTKR
jgi:hypothetical protein